MPEDRYNRSPISLREGKIFINGVEVADCVNCTINFTPEVAQVRQLGDLAQSTKYLGYTISGTLTRWRSNSWMMDMIDDYIKTRKTPEFKITGMQNDVGSDYYAENGAKTITAYGCVFTGDIPLMSLDSKGEILEDQLTFSAVGVK